MTARELIAALQQFDLDLEVVTEGCDCDGDANGVELLPKYDGNKDSIYITR